MSLLTSNVGRKVLMAASGLALVLFVVAHLGGNSSIFLGPDGINAYAVHLHSLGPLVWVFRILLAAVFAVHIWFGVTLTLENWAARPSPYAVNRKLKTTFAGKTMIWTGLFLLAFLVYHILQFTARVTPDIVLGQDAKGRFDVFAMLVSSFRLVPVSVVYLTAMAALFLHLSHGIQSVFQTLGWNNERSLPRFERAGQVLSTIFLVGFGSIPVLVLAGVLTR